MFAVKNKDGLYYRKKDGIGNEWTKNVSNSQHYDYDGAVKSAKRHNGEVIEVYMYSNGNGGYLFREKAC